MPTPSIGVFGFPGFLECNAAQALHGAIVLSEAWNLSELSACKHVESEGEGEGKRGVIAGLPLWPRSHPLAAPPSLLPSIRYLSDPHADHILHYSSLQMEGEARDWA